MITFKYFHVRPTGKEIIHPFSSAREKKNLNPIPPVKLNISLKHAKVDAEWAPDYKNLYLKNISTWGNIQCIAMNT